MSNINPNKYCDNPALYQTQLSNQIGGADTLAYYNSLCDDIIKSETAMTKIMDGLKKIKKTATGLADDAKYIGEKLSAIMTAILSPQGLETIAIFKGIDLGPKLVYKGLVNMIESGITEKITQSVAIEAMQEAGEEASEYVASAVVTRITQEVIERAIEESTRLMILELAASAAEEVMAAFDILQLVGMVLDMMDPDGYSLEITSGGSESLLGGDTNELEMINNKFNEGFTDNYLSSFKIGKDKNGRPIYGNIWPIEFFADNLLNTEKDPRFMANRHKYSREYLNCVKITNDGRPITHLCSTKSNIIDKSWLNNQKKISLSLASDNNSVVENWFLRWLPLIILSVVVLLILILFFIRVKKSK